jgi:hypothetical protein
LLIAGRMDSGAVALNSAICEPTVTACRVPVKTGGAAPALRALDCAQPAVEL